MKWALLLKDFYNHRTDVFFKAMYLQEAVSTATTQVSKQPTSTFHKMETGEGGKERQHLPLVGVL